MTIQRTTSKTSEIGALTKKVDSGILIKGILGRRYLLDIFKTAHIIKAIPEKLDYEYGSTMTAWVAAPIPRSTWSEKPIIANGAIIGVEVFGNRISGVPPGLFGEFYWNFGIIGIVLGGFLFGRMLKWFYVSFRSKSNPNCVLIYSTSVMFFAFYIVNVNVNQFIVRSVTTLIPVIISILFLSTYSLEDIKDRRNYR